MSMMKVWKVFMYCMGQCGNTSHDMLEGPTICSLKHMKDHSGPEVDQRWTRGGPEVDQKWTRGGPEVDQSGPDVDQKWIKGGPEVDQKWIKGGP